MSSVCNKILQMVIIKLAILFFLFFSCSLTQAAVYKWVDAQGKVHYSDKKIDDSAKEQNVAVGSMPYAPIVPVGQPLSYKGNKPSKWLAITKPDFALSESDEKRGKQFNFYFGGDCVSPTSLSLDEFKKQYFKYLPEIRDLQEDAIHILDTYNYRNIHFKTDAPMHDIEGGEGYIFQINIVDVKVNACKRNLRNPEDSGMLREFPIRDFDKSNAWVKIRWSIKNASGEKIFLTGISDGAANDIEGQDGQIAAIFRLAYKNSFMNILVDPEFVAYMALTTKPMPVPKAHVPDVKPQPVSSGLSGLSGLMQNSYVARANFAKALVLVNPLRMSISEYYGQHDEWPAYFSDINVDSSTLIEPGIVDSVELRLGGALHVNLSAAAFGPHQYFQLTPVPKALMMDWVCKTTLDKSLWTGSCTGI